ncbi:UDP-N-acetylmuramate dehydrogenase [Polaromonas sp.]|nr:UDP-N-acetylmuramate dehydrogenase [Candidatus Saccharibacteria bacterium]
MQFVPDVSLAEHSTMRLGGTAAFACDITSRQDLLEALMWARDHTLPYRVIGSGSNIVWADEGFKGLLIVNAINRFELFNEDERNTYLTVGAGENWDSVVERSVAAGLSGIEAMSLIPGTAGATPIQNVGAYGQDISQVVATIEAYDTTVKDFVTIPNFDCAFGYRTSKFNTTDRGRFIITALTLHLVRTSPLPPFYPAVEHYLTDMHKTASPATIRDAVVSIRTSKLPDPAKIGNNGSFFSNPIVSAADFVQLEAEHGPMRHWEVDEGVKLSGAWLIEQVGYKNLHDQATGMATWYNQPLVLVNEKAKSTADLLAFKQAIVNAVAAKFGVQLEQEPELLP